MQIVFRTFIYRATVSVVLLFLLFSGSTAYAGFGITPPYVSNTSLIRNSTYEQQILLVRGDPDTPLNAEIVVDAPEIQDWITIVEGHKILMPKGQQKVIMTVRIKVPADAKFKEYSGKIRIRTEPTDDQVAQGVVSISLGAQVDVNLDVIDKVIEDFRVRRVGVDVLNEGHKWGWLYFPGKIDFTMLLENTGNIDISPSKVKFRIFDRTGAVLLEETQQSDSIKKTAPYLTQEVVANIPTRLPAGSYMVRYSVYNGTDIKQEGELSLSILKAGTLQTAGYGFSGLSLSHKISVILPILSVLIILLYFIYNRRSKKYISGELV